MVEKNAMSCEHASHSRHIRISEQRQRHCRQTLLLSAANRRRGNAMDCNHRIFRSELFCKRTRYQHQSQHRFSLIRPVNCCCCDVMRNTQTHKKSPTQNANILLIANAKLFANKNGIRLTFGVRQHRRCRRRLGRVCLSVWWWGEGGGVW